MGCCFSAPETEQLRSIDGAPSTSPPCVLEEETVKEVLLETPVVSKADEKIKATPPANEPTPLIHGNSDSSRKENEEIVREVTQVLEMYSYSGSLSNTTSQGKKEDDEDGVVNQRPPPRKRRAETGGRGRGERVISRMAAAPPSEKRGQVAPLRPVRGVQPRNVAEENGRRGDPGEGSERRSRSPVRRGEVGDRRSARDEKAPATGEPPNDVVSAEEAESLENPVVSLECFIFL